MLNGRFVKLPLFQIMSRRRMSSSLPAERSAKRVKIEHLTKEDFKNALVLAPMVRSGALPTRLYALKHGANLVWGPEIIDKAILHSTRNVDPVTGVINYDGKSRAIFATHPIEKPYLIYQIGSADPELAVQAAKTVMQDVSGVDLNCGCPKPFSTHSGMGAALLTNPDLLCSILVALREAMPLEITVTAKIRLLPSQEDTLKLVERIVNTGISALTVHCRTRNMREKDTATIERLREIKDFVDGMGKGIAVIENGDCLGYEDAKRVKEVTGADSVMIARAAESNPSVFSPIPLIDIAQTLIPDYLRLAQYLGTHWSLTKFCVAQFKGKYVNSTKKAELDLRNIIVKCKGFADLDGTIVNWTGEEVFRDIVRVIEARPSRTRYKIQEDGKDVPETETDGDTKTPPNTQNPEPATSKAPIISDFRRFTPAMVTGEDPLTPTPSMIIST